MHQERLQGMSSGGMSASGSSTPTYRSVHYATLPEEKDYSRPISSKSRSSSSSRSASYRIQYRVYRWRWLMLAALCALNISNGMVRPPVWRWYCHLFDDFICSIHCSLIEYYFSLSLSLPPPSPLSTDVVDICPSTQLHCQLLQHIGG